MTNYIIKRLFLMILTLFGICLVSFLVINLAPGDPADKSAPGAGGGTESNAISDLVIRKNKERMFLDKPILFNSAPDDRRSTAVEMIEDLTSGDEYVVEDVMEKGRLNDLGTAALEPLITELEGKPREEDARVLLRALKKIAGSWELAKDDPRLVGTVEARSAAWVSWWASNKEDYSYAKGAALVDDIFKAWASFDKAGAEPVERFFAAQTPELEDLRKRARKLGQLTVPALMERYNGSSGDERRVAAGSLSIVANKVWDFRIDEQERNGFAKEWSGQRELILKRVETFARGFGVPEAEAALTELEPEAQEARLKELRSRAAAQSGEAGAATELKKAIDVAFLQLGRLGPKEAFIDGRAERAFSDHERGWRNWWERRQEYFLEFDGSTRYARMFTDTRFGHWLAKLLVLDFGVSYTTNRPVIEMIQERFWVTFKMNFSSLLLTYLIAIPIGIFSATNQYSLSDRVSTVLLFILYSLPTFWVGAMMIWLLTGDPYLDWFPSAHAVSQDHMTMTGWEQFWDEVWHLTLPVICLTYGGIAYISRQMRAGMLETVRQDYIRTARAKGLPESKVVFKHALRNSLIPIITLLANLLPLMIGGSVIIEQIFSIEGLGKLSFEAVLNRDYPVIMTIFTFSGVLTLLGILFSDILYALVDPRISYS